LFVFNIWIVSKCAIDVYHENLFCTEWGIRSVIYSQQWLRLLDNCLWVTPKSHCLTCCLVFLLFPFWENNFKYKTASQILEGCPKSCHHAKGVREAWVTWFSLHRFNSAYSPAPIPAPPSALDLGSGAISLNKKNLISCCLVPEFQYDNCDDFIEDLSLHSMYTTSTQLYSVDTSIVFNSTSISHRCLIWGKYP
jgi:hypothetical protein